MQSGAGRLHGLLIVAMGMLVILSLSLLIEPADSDNIQGKGSGSGLCGDDMHWALHTNGVLDIYGSGYSWSYEDMRNPLTDYKDMIEYVKIDFGVQGLDPSLLAPCQNIKRIDLGRDMEYFEGGSASLEEVHMAKKIGEESEPMQYLVVNFSGNVVNISAEDLVTLADQDAVVSLKQLRGPDVPEDLRAQVGYDSLYELKVGDLTELKENAYVSLLFDSALHFKVMHLQPDYMMAEGVYYNYYITFECDEPGYLLLQVQKKTFIPYPEAVGLGLALFFTICAYIYYRRVLKEIES